MSKILAPRLTDVVGLSENKSFISSTLSGVSTCGVRFFTLLLTDPISVNFSTNRETVVSEGGVKLNSLEKFLEVRRAFWVR